MKYQIILGILGLIFFFSCESDKQFYFDDPFNDHYTFLGLSKDVKSVSYEQQIFEITDGGYFPNNAHKNINGALKDYPNGINELYYMANLNRFLIFNYPITANQYLINELQLNENSYSNNIKIELQDGKIINYSNQDNEGKRYKLISKYDEDGNISKLTINSKYPKTVYFKHNGSFIEEIIEKRNQRTDTISFILNTISENEISITRKDTDSQDRKIIVYLNNTSSKKILEKIVYIDNSETFEFENNKLVLYTRVKDNGDFRNYQKIEYKGNQVKRMLNSSSFSKNTIDFDLNSNSLISAINVETDKERMRDIGPIFEYKFNSRNDWSEMSYYVDRKHYDDAKYNIERVKERLRKYGYSELQISRHNDVYRALLNAELTKSFSAKTTIKRNLKYH